MKFKQTTGLALALAAAFGLAACGSKTEQPASNDAMMSAGEGNDAMMDAGGESMNSGGAMSDDAMASGNAMSADDQMSSGNAMSNSSDGAMKTDAPHP